MRWRRITGLVATSTMLALAACTAIAGLDGDFEARDSATTPDTTDARGVDDGQANNSDGPTNTNDSSPPIDAGADVTFAFDEDAALAPPGPTTSAWCFTQNDTFNDSGVGGPGLSRTYCFDFDGTLTKPTFGWDTSSPDGGVGLQQIFPGTGGGKAIRATLTATGASTSTNLESIFGVGEHPYDRKAGQGYLLSFKFQIRSAETSAVIGGFDFFGRRFGLAVYSKGCAGHDCIGDSDETAPAASGARTAFTLSTWYEASVRITRVADNGTWSSEVKVGGKTVAARSLNAMPSEGSPDAFGRIIVGAFSSGLNGTTEVDIDDVVAWRFPNPL